MSKWVKAEPSPVGKLRKKWLKKGFDLINITSLCEPKLGNSGWCNEFNEPEENIFYIQIWYRDEQVANINSSKSYVIDDNKYLMFIDNEEDITGADFIIFRKVKL